MRGSGVCYVRSGEFLVKSMSKWMIHKGMRLVQFAGIPEIGNSGTWEERLGSDPGLAGGSNI